MRRKYDEIFGADAAGGGGGGGGGRGFGGFGGGGSGGGGGHLSGLDAEGGIGSSPAAAAATQYATQ